MLSAITFTFAQGSYEAFRFSQIDYMGTARYMGAGGAFSATGGDFSALNTNPAAIGIYKRNEVSFTPLTLSFFKDNTLYNGSSSYTQNPKYTVPQCGLVISSPINNSAWKRWQFGFGYNRIMDFNNTFRIEGPNHSSFIDPVLDYANGNNFNSLYGDALIAWNTFMIDTIPGRADRYFSPFHNKDIDQTAVVSQYGGLDEMTITFGGNYNDQLYLGASIGIPILDYTEQTTLAEEISGGGNAQGINKYKVASRQTDRGAGINAKIGVIYQPVNFLRLSAAIQTPTYFSRISDTYTREMTSYWPNNTLSSDYTNNYRFALSSPFRFNVGTSFIINKRAFISAEYEFNDYGMATLYANDYNFANENEDIRSNFGTCHTLRIGGEISLTPKFMLRAGYNLKTSPYLKSNDASDLTAVTAPAHYGSIGFGYHSNFMFFDIAYVLRYSKDNYTLYTTNSIANGYSTTAQIKNTTHRIVATIGCKF